jgi:hypothetical protein
MNNKENAARLAVRIRTASILATLRAILSELSTLPETDRRKELIASNRSMIEVIEKMLASIDADISENSDE